MRITRGRVFALLAGALVAAAGCSTREDPTPGREGAVTVTVQVSGEAEEVAVYQAAVNAFENAAPGIDVDLVGVAEKSDHLARLATAFAGGTPPDVFLVNFREYSQFVSRGAIEPAGDHLDEADIDLEGYFSPPVEAFTYEGVLQCMPQNISSLVVYYNTDLFDAAGIERPAGDWSWGDFRSAALALTNDQERGLGIDPQLIRLAPFVWANGGDIVDDLESPSRLTLDTPAAREAFEFIVSLVRDDQVVPTEKELAAQDLETRFVTGKLGMLLSSRKDTPVFREVLGLNWDVLALPAAPTGDKAGILHSDGYCIASTSDHVDEAMRLIAFMVGPEGGTITALGGRTVPALESVASSGAFLDPSQPPEHSEVFLDGVPFIRRTPVIPTWPEIEDVTEEILTRAFYEDGYSIDDALRELEEATAPLFEDAG